MYHYLPASLMLLVEVRKIACLYLLAGTCKIQLIGLWYLRYDTCVMIPALWYLRYDTCVTYEDLILFLLDGLALLLVTTGTYGRALWLVTETSLKYRCESDLNPRPDVLWQNVWTNVLSANPYNQGRTNLWPETFMYVYIYIYIYIL